MAELVGPGTVFPPELCSGAFRPTLTPGPAVTFATAEHHPPLPSTKLYSLMTEVHDLCENNLPEVIK